MQYKNYPKRERGQLFVLQGNNTPMLKKSHRLRAAEVARITRGGKSFRAPLLSIRVMRNVDGTMRAAAVAGRSVAKTAVMRNRLRRAVYRTIASLPSYLMIPANIVVFVHAAPSTPVAGAFRKDLEKLLQEARKFLT